MIRLKILLIFVSIIICVAPCVSQIHKQGIWEYHKALDELKAMLEDKQTLSFKRAVFITENAYHNNTLDYGLFAKQIKMFVSLSKGFIENQPLLYDESDRETVAKYASIFKIMTDTIPIEYKGQIVYHLPFTYDFEDFWGEKDWTKMFVSKLIESKKGNCHSLPYLYKIIAEELNAKAYFALAPNHLYIKHWSKKDGWYNTELTNGSFPIDAWLMASGYIKLEAIQNGIYMDTLSSKQSIALCVIDLAKGFEKKYPQQSKDFILACCDLTLKYFPNYMNALLLKAETIKKDFESICKKAGAKYPSDIFYIKEAKEEFDTMEEIYINIHQLGYREMPKQMYINWLAELEKEKDKYTNKNIKSNFKN